MTNVHLTTDLLNHAASAQGFAPAFTATNTGGDVMAYVMRVDADALLVLTHDVLDDVVAGRETWGGLYTHEAWENGGDPFNDLEGALADVLSWADTITGQ